MLKVAFYAGGLGVFFLLLPVSSGQAQQNPASQTTAALTTILPISEARKMVYQITWHGKKGHFGFRSLAAQEVARLEADLPAYAETVPMPSWRSRAARVDITTYIRQYAGVTQQGKRLIYVNAFSPGFLSLFHEHVPDWHKHAFDIADGGTGVFRATYDPQTRRFTDFSFNGPA